MVQRVVVCVLFVVSMCLTLSYSAHAVREADHPYFQSEEYRKTAEEIQRNEAEIQRLDSELKQLQSEKSRIGSTELGFLQLLTVLPFFSINVIILTGIISILGIVLYTLYLKNYNPAKYFILFKSKDNISILLRRIKEYNKLIVILGMALVLQQGTCYAETDIVTDCRYLLFGNNIERGYVYVKYPKKGRAPGYSEIAGVKLYPEAGPGSFEQSYNLMVHENALGMPVTGRDLVKLIERCRTLENLGDTYSFVFKFPDPVIKDVVQKRMAALPRLRGDVRYEEADRVLKLAAASGRLALVGEDVVTALHQLIPDASSLADQLELSYLLAYVDRGKARDLFDRVKYRFKDIVENNTLEPKFVKAFTALSRGEGFEPLYKPAELTAQLEEGGGLSVRVARLLDPMDNELARSIVNKFSLERYRYLNPSQFEDLAYLMKKYRSGELQELLMRLTMDFLKTSTKDLKGYLRLTQSLGFDSSAAAAALVKQDAELHGAKGENSSLVSQEFLDLLSGEDLAKHLEYFKTRTPQGRLILRALFDRRYDLFGDYLDFCYSKDPQLLEGQTYPNRMLAISKWKEILSERDSSLSLPAEYYLVDQESAKPAPDNTKIKLWLGRGRDDLFNTIISNDGSLTNGQLAGALVLLQLHKGAKNTEFDDSVKVLDEVIGRQTKERLEARASSIRSRLQELQARVQTLSAEVSAAKSTQLSLRIRVIIASILVIVLAIYTIVAFFYSIKYSVNAVSPYSTTRIGLFALVFSETFAKFLLPIPYYTLQALSIVILIHLYGFLRSRDGEFPNVQRALASHRAIQE